MQISPILETIFLLVENDRSPIILLEPLDLISSTGSVLMLTPMDLSKYEVWFINKL